jgi:hypothetical protein
MSAIPIGAAGQAAQHTLTSTMSGTSTVIISGLDGMSTAAIAEAATGAEVAAAINQALGQNAPATAITGSGATKGPWVITIPTELLGPLKGNTPLTCTVTGTGEVKDVVTQEGIVGGDELQGTGQVPSEVPHIVGASGQAAYANGFETPVGKTVTPKFPSAAPASAAYAPAQFYIDADGFVHLEGVAVPSGAVAAGKAIFTLPELYRPFLDQFQGAVLIKANGEVQLAVAVSGANEAVSIAASFRPVGI